jgi:trimeric autotransporter adhesin
LWLVLPGLVLLTPMRSRNRRRTMLPVSLVALLVLVLALALASCGGSGGSSGTSSTGTTGGSGGGGTTQQGTPAGSYSIVVTGTSGALSSQAPAVTLTVN